MLPDTITVAEAWQNLARDLRARWHQRRANAERPFEAAALDRTYIDEDLTVLAHLGEIGEAPANFAGVDPNTLEDDEPDDRCSNPGGHEWTYTGTQYGGDDDRWHGEGRCYCIHCGADGDA